jgi:hypothetical protein
VIGNGSTENLTGEQIHTVAIKVNLVASTRKECQSTTTSFVLQSVVDPRFVLTQRPIALSDIPNYLPLVDGYSFFLKPSCILLEFQSVFCFTSFYLICIHRHLIKTL